MLSRRNVNLALLSAVAMSGLSSVARAANVPTIGVIVPTLDSEFWNRYIAFTKTGAEQLGANLIVLNADNKPDNMLQFTQDLISRHVDGIISVGYWSSAPATIRFAQRANIPVVITDSYPEFAPLSDKHENYIAFVGPSDKDAGYHMGKALLAGLTPGADGKKVIGVVNGTPGTSVAIDRRKGLAQAIAEEGADKVTIAGEVEGNFVRDQAQSAFEALYQGHPEIKGVFASNDPMAMGVIAALERTGKVPGKDVLVVGMDLNGSNVIAMKGGKQLFDIGGHWLQGGIGLLIMYDYLHGFKLPADQSNFKLKLLPMTQPDVVRFDKDFPGGQPNFDFKAHSKVYNKDAPAADTIGAAVLRYSN
ncbi:ABC transporter substrate-binding protein [Acidisoma cladoniae]|jgi:ABC-type sugar transport system substrate-binding protein|uniref:ABC transporter substrate-binding protein n=1 Tax=Acidisoma cladoniae TaxID=3040935 RepID=UPI002550A722|nr:ABC transporter substrate-binding protein [Acidisoma sp. PAMC 29798]